MEALSKESKFAALVLTWAQRRSDLREINGRRVCKKFIARLEPVLLFEDGYIPTHYNTANYNWPRQMTRVGFATNIRLHVF